VTPSNIFKHKEQKRLEESWPEPSSLLGDKVQHTEVGRGMGLLSRDTTVDSLIDDLEDEREEVKLTAILALEEEGSELAIEALVDCLRDEDESIRNQAIESLVVIGDRAAMALIKAVRDPALREGAGIALERIRDNLLERLKRKE
jgi:HEAT repeat protein